MKKRTIVRKAMSAFLSLAMLLSMIPSMAFATGDSTDGAGGGSATEVVLPSGVTADTFDSNTVTDGTNYYATLQAAVEAVEAAKTVGAALYCKPEADVGSLQHAPVINTLTVYGNGAYVSGGAERDFDIGNTDPSGGKDITADMTLTVSNLDGCGAWGTKATEHTVNLVFDGCKNMGKVFLTGTTGTLNITIKDCAFEGVISEAVYSNANGAIEITGTAFSNLTKAINLNHKAAGAQTVTLSGCTFTNCGKDVAGDQIPVRVLSSVDGGTSALTVSNCTFSGTPAGGADILLDYGIGETTVSVSGTAANVTVETEDNVATTAVTAADNKTFTNVALDEPTSVATYDELVAALAAGKDVKLTADIIAPDKATLTLNNQVLDLGSNKLTINGESGTMTDSTIKNGTIEITTYEGDTVADGVFDVYGASSAENVTFTSTKSAIYAIFDFKTGDFTMTGCDIEMSNNNPAGGLLYFNGGNSLTMTECTVTATDVGDFISNGKVVMSECDITLKGTVAGGLDNGINGAELTLNNTNVKIDGATGRGITTDGDAIAINGTSNVTLTNCAEGGLRYKASATVTVADTASFSGTVKVDAAATEAKINDTTVAVTGTELPTATVENGAVSVVEEGTVATVNGIGYPTLAAAIAAANALTGNVTVEIYGKVEYTDSTPNLIGAYDTINFVGKTDDAEISITRNGSGGYISGINNDCTVNFADLILSKPQGGYANDAGNMNNAFTVYRVGKVNYTNCTFPNGACAAGCPTTYTECTFKKSHDKYAMWAYGADVTVDKCVFDDDRGIKMYAEGAAKTTSVTVTNSDFSKLTGKPAIVATLGNSIMLSGNTYSAKGVLELEDNGSSNGIAVTSDKDVTCISDAYPNGCGVLVDGKIYRTVAEAAAVATEGSDVVLLHDSTETVEFVEGVELNKNGHTADGVTVKTSAVAYIGEVGYPTLAAAIAAAVEGDTITLAEGTFEEGTIKFPATLKNVTIKGAEDKKSILKDMTIMAYDGNSWDYQGLTFYGIAFDNSRISITGWRTGGVTFKKFTVTNCEFKNLNDTTNNAPVHINLDADEACNGFTFTNNVIDGVTGGSKSGVYLQATGEVVFDKNVINNVSFRPYVVQITTDDGVADNFVVTNNTFSGSAAGRAQGLGNNGAGTDNVTLKVNNNIFKDITNAQQICYWNFNDETTTADLSHNYYDIDIATNPSAIYYNASASSVADLVSYGVYPIYTKLNENGTIDVSSLTEAPVSNVAEVNGTGYTTLADAVAALKANGGVLKLLADANESITLNYPEDGAATELIIDLNGYTITSGESTLWVSDGYDVTINDSSESKTGKIITTNVNAEAIAIARGGKVTLNGGYVYSDSDAVYLYNGNSTGEETFIMNGGTIEIPNGGRYALAVGNGTAIINDGASIICNKVSGGSGWAVYSWGSAEIKGGTFKGALDGDVVITGGTYSFCEDDSLNTDLIAPFYGAKKNEDGSFTVYKLADGLSGTGTETDPYLITNLDELKWFRDQVDTQASDGSTQFAGKYFKLTADIDLAGENWNPIGSMSGDHGSFKGVFDGDGHTISNLNVEQAGNGLGLFARTAGNAEIKNLTLNNVTLKSTDNSNYVGGVVGNAYASTKISNVHVTGNIDISGRGYIGGIAGHGYVVMDNVSVKGEGTIYSTFWCAGGILGYGGEGATNITNAVVEGTGATGLVVKSAAGGLGSIVGMAEDNDGTQPISGANLTAKNVKIETYEGAYGTSYAEYALGYLYGGSEISKLSGTLTVENVTFKTSTGNTAPAVCDAVATIDGAIYFDLASALKEVASGDTVTLLRDVTITEAWDNRYTGAKFTVPVTIDGNGKAIKFACDVQDGGNQHAPFRFQADATVKNLTVDMSEATNSKNTTRIRAISSSADLIVDNCHFIGNPAYTNTRAIIFGEGSGSAIGDVDVSVTNSTFKDWTKGVGDNENAQDAKTVTVTGNTFTNAKVALSAHESVTFTGNTMTDGYYVTITSYTENNTLNVTATGNTLAANTESNYNWVDAGGTVDAQEDFLRPVSNVAFIDANANGTQDDDETGYATLDAAIAAANAEDTITVLADIAVSDSVIIGKKITLDLNGKTVSATSTLSSKPVIRVLADVTVTNGTVDGTTGINSYAFIVGNNDVAGALNIADGTYKGITSAISITKGTANISGGTFRTAHDGEGTDYGAQYLLNCLDANWVNGEAKYNVTGGTFVGFNPANNAAEGAGTNFVAEGYAALKNLSDQYVVGVDPTATIENLGSKTVPAGDYMAFSLTSASVDTSKDMPLNFVMQYKANQTAADMDTSPYADWYGDFVITFTGLENGSFIADENTYLAGYYGETENWTGDWVKVGITDMTVEEGARYPVMTGVGMPQTYEYICAGVQEFLCAMNISEDILKANPNLQVNLELAVVDSSDGNKALEALTTADSPYVKKISNIEFDAEDFVVSPVVATVTLADGTQKITGDTLTAVLAEIKNLEGAASAVIDINSAITESAKVDVTLPLTINGNGNTLTYTGSDRAIDVSDTATGVSLEINDLTVDCTSSYCQRGINYNTNGNLTLNGVTVKGENVTYAVNLPGSATNANVNIEKSDISGCIALNIWGANSKITVTDSVLTSIDKATHEDYAAIALNDNGEISAKDATITVTGGKIYALNENGSMDDPENKANWSLAVRNADLGTVTISDSTKVYGNIDKAVNVALVRYGEYNEFYGYSSLQDAIEKAEEDAANGITNAWVQLIDNIELTENVKVTGTVTVDLNGKKLTGPDDGKANWYAFIVDGGNLTLKDSSENKTGEIWAKCYGVETKSGTFTMESGKITATNNATLGSAIVNYGGTVNVKAGTLSGNLAAVYTGGYFNNAATTIASGIDMTGPVVVEDWAGKDFTETVSSAANNYATGEGYEWVQNGDVYDLTEAVYVAEVNGVGYATLAKAVAAANAGDTVTLLADVEVVSGETITLNSINLTSPEGITLTNNGTIEVTGESTLNIATLSGNSIRLLEGAIIEDSKVVGNARVYGNVIFRGDNTFTMITDYGDYYKDHEAEMWTVEEGGSLTLTSYDRYGLGYGDKVTVYGTLADGAAVNVDRSTMTEKAAINMYGGLVGMTNSAAPNAQNSFTAENAYLRFGYEGDKSFGNKPAYYGNYTFTFDNVVMDANGYKFYEDNGTSTVTYTNSDVLVGGQFMTNDASSTFNFTNTKVVSQATSNGNDDKNQNAGAMNLVGSDITYNALFTNVGTINMDAASKLTAPSIANTGTIIIDATGATEGLVLVEQTDADAAALTNVTVNNVPTGYEVSYENGDVTIVKSEEVETGTITDNGRDLSLDGVIYINQYVSVEGVDVDVEEKGGLLVWTSEVTDATAKFENAEIVKEGLVKLGDEYYQQSNGIAAAQYADTLWMRAYVEVSEGNYIYSPLKEYSVRYYCDTVIETTQKEMLKETCISLLHYGAAAQILFDYNSDDLANKNIVDTYPAYEWDKSLLTALDDFTTNITASESVVDNGKDLSLDGATMINYYYGVKDITVAKAELLVWDGVTAELTADNVSYTVDMKYTGTEYYAQSDMFAAAEYGKTIFACARFTDSEGNEHYSDVVAFSPEAYAAKIIENSDKVDLVAAMKDMVTYGEKAKIYFASIG